MAELARLNEGPTSIRLHIVNFFTTRTREAQTQNVWTVSGRRRERGEGKEKRVVDKWGDNQCF